MWREEDQSMDVEEGLSVLQGRAIRVSQGSEKDDLVRRLLVRYEVKIK